MTTSTRSFATQFEASQLRAMQCLRSTGEGHLFSMGQGPEPARADWHWVGTEAAAAALCETGPDEALCCIWDTIDGDGDIAKRFAGVRASGHPEAEHVASSVEAFVASGAPLTIRQGVQLKVALKYAKPLVWRSVQLPLTATLGDLHAAIQVLFGWDGDHPHVFHAGGVHYSDPFYELEETEGEQDARLRDVFPPGGPRSPSGARAARPASVIGGRTGTGSCLEFMCLGW